MAEPTRDTTMRTLLGILIGIALVIGWQHTWRALLGWALSRGDTP